MSRRKFIKTGALATAGAVAAPLVPGARAGALLLSGDAVFRPYPAEKAPPVGFVYAADEHEDPFQSGIRVDRAGITIPDDFGSRKFSVNARWFVEGFGYLWLGADNAGSYYTREEVAGRGGLNLNIEFARSRVSRNDRVSRQYASGGTEFSGEVRDITGLSHQLLADALRAGDGEKGARIADRALKSALQAGELIELEKARSDIRRRGRAENVFFGCESRQFVWAKSEEFTRRFPELFDFATVTHYVWDSWYELFEPREGRYNWGIKNDIVNWLCENNITIEGRPLFWFHPTVTPDWLRRKDFAAVKAYVEKHTHDLVRHYGDRVLQWEVINEAHDWANIHNFTSDQITEITRLACDRTKQENPRVVRIINNCCPFGEYVARGRMARMDATRPLRTPRKFIEDLVQAGVEFDILGIQIYFPQRDLSEIARLLERLAVFGKPVYITEIGASSNLTAPSSSGAITASPDEPFAWHRRWDEELQADWLEQVYTIYYSKPYIRAINWYDFSDFRPFIVNGGLVREDCSPKQSFERLKSLLGSWNVLPKGR